VAATKVDGKAWVKNTDRSQVMRLDLETGQYENLGTFRNPANNRPIGIYGIYADQQNNAYILEFPVGGIGKIDAKTGKLAFYPTPTPNARARRGRVDFQNRLWFAEYGGNGVGCSIPRRRRSLNGRSRWRGKRLMTFSPIATAKPGRSIHSPTESADSIHAAANGRIISCHATATFAACSSTIGTRQ
jgi:hypothetical protein